MNISPSLPTTAIPPAARLAVGARVVVLREGRLFAAEVVKCHSITGRGRRGVRNNGTEGTFVPREGHWLLLLEKGGAGGGRRADEASCPRETQVHCGRLHQGCASEWCANHTV